MQKGIILSGVVTADFGKVIRGYEDYGWIVEEIFYKLSRKFKLLRTEHNSIIFSDGFISVLQMASIGEGHEFSLAFRDVVSSSMVDSILEGILYHCSSVTVNCTIKVQDNLNFALSKLYVNAEKFSKTQTKTYWFQTHYRGIQFEVSVYTEKLTFYVSFKVDSETYKENLFT
ncbi:MAG: hypothetical protein QXO62_02370, partial [Thermoproteota archaeon]